MTTQPTPHALRALTDDEPDFTSTFTALCSCGWTISDKRAYAYVLKRQPDVAVAVKGTDRDTPEWWTLLASVCHEDTKGSHAAKVGETRTYTEAGMERALAARAALRAATPPQEA